VPEDVGGQPFSDGEEPEDDRHGAADEEFATVVLDEEFVRAAEIHEPTAHERTLAAAQSHTETEVPHPYDDGYVYGPAGDGDPAAGYGGYPGGRDHDDEDHPDAYGTGDAYGAYDREDEPYGAAYAGPRPYRGHVRWQRPVAWVLAVVMGVGIVALAFAAVYRGASVQRNEPGPPPPTTGVGAPAEEGTERVGSAPGPGGERLAG
jgi:hypothetical protein